MRECTSTPDSCQLKPWETRRKQGFYPLCLNK